MSQVHQIQIFDARVSRLPRRELLAAVLLAILTALVLLSQPFSARAADATDGSTTPAETPAAADMPSGPETAIPTQNLWNIISKGGPLMFPLGVCSFMLVAFVFERIISLRRRRIIPKPFVTRMLEQLKNGELDREKALELCAENGSPVAEVFAGALHKWGRPEVEVEQAIIDAGERVTNGLRRNLRVINGLATVSPLLGIMGTVTGMINAFNAIATSDALGRPELLASGISEALITTAAGLCIAIPALICHMYFASRVDRLIIEIDSLGQRVVTMISSEDIENLKKRPAASKPQREMKRAAA